MNGPIPAGAAKKLFSSWFDPPLHYGGDVPPETPLTRGDILRMTDSVDLYEATWLQDSGRGYAKYQKSYSHPVTKVWYYLGPDGACIITRKEPDFSHFQPHISTCLGGCYCDMCIRNGRYFVNRWREYVTQRKETRDELRWIEVVTLCISRSLREVGSSILPLGEDGETPHFREPDIVNIVVAMALDYW